MRIRELDERDWPAVAAIYDEGIQSRSATLETQVPSWDAWDAAHLAAPRLVAIDDDVVAWAALSPMSRRECYRGVASLSIYVAAKARGRGVGRMLLERLVEASERAGIWTLEAWMFPENEASVALHRRSGFRLVGVRERIAQLDGVWRDALLFERRSPAL